MITPGGPVATEARRLATAGRSGPARFPRAPPAGRGRRFRTVDFVAGDDPDEVVATPRAGAGQPAGSRAAAVYRRAALRAGPCRERDHARADAQARSAGDPVSGALGPVEDEQ